MSSTIISLHISFWYGITSSQLLSAVLRHFLRVGKNWIKKKEGHILKYFQVGSFNWHLKTSCHFSVIQAHKYILKSRWTGCSRASKALWKNKVSRRSSGLQWEQTPNKCQSLQCQSKHFCNYAWQVLVSLFFNLTQLSQENSTFPLHHQLTLLL